MLASRLEPPAPFRPHASGSIVVQEVGPPRSLKSGGPVRLSRAVFEIFIAVGDRLSRLSGTSPQLAFVASQIALGQFVFPDIKG
jgi:hypothetical protein